MSVRRVMILAAVATATIVGTTVTQASAAPAVFYPQVTGYGATSQAAETAAREELVADYVCRPPDYLVADGQETNGTWWATMSAACTAYV
jgi:hypothetical protein